jgi:hypothetical protein
MKKQYKIISGTLKAVEEDVTNFLIGGWELHGQLSVTEHTIPNPVNPNERLILIYSQVLIKD